MSDSAQPSPAWLRWLAPALPVGAAFLLALTRIEDPDAFTHLAHHRGQLTVYLRLNGAPVPSVYDPSADERSFG